jgi:hypothetical protein
METERERWRFLQGVVDGIRGALPELEARLRRFQPAERLADRIEFLVREHREVLTWTSMGSKIPSLYVTLMLMIFAQS